MSVKLKPITEKSWLVIGDTEDTNIGLLTETRNQYLLMMKGKKQQFLSRKDVNTFFNEDVFNNIGTEEKNIDEKRDFFVNGYPVNFDNPVETTLSTSNLPLFRKKDTSDVYYCAGYYCIKFSDSWLHAFCPKLSTLQEYEYKGPFKSKIDLQVALKTARKEDRRRRGVPNTEAKE